MKGKIFTLATLLILALAFKASAQVFEDGWWYTLHEGSMSYRMDGSLTPPISPNIIPGTYFGADAGGAKTLGWNSGTYVQNGDTTGYKDMSLFFSNNLGNIDQPSDLLNPNVQYYFRMNMRMAVPQAYKEDPNDPNAKYPLIIMMHGVGETSNCRNNCNTSSPDYLNNDHNLYHGGRDHADAILRDPSNSRHWPGFVLFPQSTGWGASIPSTPTADNDLGNPVRLVKMIIDLLIQGYPIDPYRIYIHGLSNGGQGAYLLMYENPELIAAGAGMSGISSGGYSSRYGWPGAVPTTYPPQESIVHLPLWHFQGSNDGNPTPQFTNYFLDIIRNAGGNVRYTEYANTGHNTWTRAYREPDFFSWFLQYSKLSIHSYFGLNQICEGETQRLGLSPGFVAYEWQKSTDGGNNWVPFPGAPGKPNEILADEAGLYRARVQRDAGNGVIQELEWSPWSEPFELIQRERPTPVISTNGSWVLWGLDNNTSLTLSADNAEASNYVWRRNDAPYVSGDDANEIVLNVNGQGVYTVQYDDEFCTSYESEPVFINRAPTTVGVPAVPTPLNGESTSISTTTIWWSDVATEIGFEVYRSLDGGANYVWLGNFPENTVSFDDSNLPANQSIFYKVRAFNENGASAASTVEIVMPVDNTPPAIPTNFKFARFGIEEIRSNPRAHVDGQTKYDETYRVHLDEAVFTWNPVGEESTVNYDIYSSDGTLVGTTQDTSFTVTGLDENESYGFYAKARDINNLESGKTQQASVFTALNGLYYYYYQGAIWDIIADYSFHPYSDQGSIHNFLINFIPEHDFPDYFAYDFFGFINIPEAGEYEFRTNSDDGSSLWIDHVMVVENDGLHGGRNREGIYDFPEAGVYPITVKYFERTGGNSLSVSWRKVGSPSFSSIPNSQLTSTSTEPAPLPEAPVNLSATANGYSVDLSWEHEKEDIKVVVLGSSTAAGTGASAGNSWVDKFTQSLEAQDTDNDLTNLALGGYTTYHILPTGTITGSRPTPDPARNITAALALNPDIIIVNLPSNDRANGYDIQSETIANMQTVKTLAESQGVEIYFTSTQPRNFPTQGERDLLAEEASYINQNFGVYSISIYDELAAADGTIKPGYNSGDGIHLNDAGHNYLFQTIWNKVNGQSIPLYEVFRSEGGVDFDHVLSTNKQQVSITNSNLMGGTTYTYKVRAVTNAGPSAYSGTQNATTASDIEPPTIPLNFRTAAITESSVTVLWNASTDNVGVEKYVVVDVTNTPLGGRVGSSTGKLNEIVLGETNLTSMTLTGLTPLEEYEMVVYAVDFAGNESDYSNRVTFSTNAPLPVEFLEVGHKLVPEGVLITWATASELNNSHFTVERGTGIDDFTPIGGVDGSGTTSSRHDYVFLDENPLSIAYYRIKQTDFDGQFDYSKIIRVVYDESNQPEFTVFPNPTSQENIQARGFVPSNKSVVQVKLLDVMGKTHMIKEIDPNEFLNGVKIDLNYPVPPGVYIISISDGSTNTQRRLVIR
jgi:predicted esterase/lysophospholipase L1-like esterase